MSRRDDLEALRVGLFEAFEHGPEGTKAQVAAQLRAVIKDLAELPEEKEANPVDEFAAARARRRANSKVS